VNSGTSVIEEIVISGEAMESIKSGEGLTDELRAFVDGYRIIAKIDKSFCPKLMVCHFTNTLGEHCTYLVERKKTE
jgi:hypothetical protein